MPMLSIGIDVSKGKSTVCGMKPGGEIVYAPFEVQHTREGMLELVSLGRSFNRPDCRRIHIGSFNSWRGSITK